MREIEEKLFASQDLKYKSFHTSLVPENDPETFIGVRVPELRKIAKNLYKDEEKACAFMDEAPHKYFEERQIHGFLICEIKDYDTFVFRAEQWLPCVDNWAVCDGKSPKGVKKHLKEFRSKVEEWIDSGKPYYIRFGIEILMAFYLDDEFDDWVLEKVSRVRSQEYYVNMMISWFFATALAKQWDSSIVYITERKLDHWCHNKTIQKARESFRITDSQKEFLAKHKV